MFINAKQIVYIIANSDIQNNNLNVPKKRMPMNDSRSFTG